MAAPEGLLLLTYQCGTQVVWETPVRRHEGDYMLAGKLCSRHAAMPIKHLQCSVHADNIVAHAGGYKGMLQAGQGRHPLLLKRNIWQLWCQTRTAPLRAAVDSCRLTAKKP